MKKKQKKWISILLATFFCISVILSGCGGSSSSGTEVPAGTKEEQSAEAPETEAPETEADEAEAAEAEAPETEAAEAEAAEAEAAEAEAPAAEAENVTLTLFAAKSLNTVMEDIIVAYQASHPGIEIIGNYDSSGTLQTQIQEGAACDIFFSAAQKQMNTLADDGFVIDKTRHNVVNNQVVVVTWPGSGTKVTGLENLSEAANMALADGSVPVGKYTRQALVNAGILTAPADGDVSLITTREVSEALGGLEINECANVGAVAAAVSEGSNEVGTTYYSDTCGLEDRLEILQIVSYDLTGDVIYPIAQIVNPEADDAQAAAAAAFIEYVASAECKEVFQKYYFDTDVTD